MHGSWEAPGPCWRSQLLHKNRFLQTHAASMKDGMLIKHTLQTWPLKEWIPTCMAGTWASLPRPPALPAQRSRLLYRCTLQKSWIAFWTHSSLFMRRPQTPHACEIDPRLKHPKGDSHNQQHQIWKQRIKLGPARAWLLGRKEIKHTIIRPKRTSMEHQ